MAPGLGRRDAKAAVRQMRLLGRHPLLDDAAAEGAVTVSWAREMAGWAGRIGDEDMQQDADQILLEAAKAGADLDGLRVIAQAAYEAWRATRPDDDPAGEGLEDGFLQLDTTMDGAGRLIGDRRPSAAPRSPRCWGPSARNAAPKTTGPPPSGSTTHCRRAG